MTMITNSEHETEQIGFALAEKLCPGTVLAFSGDLGAGKTVFVRGLARGFGIAGRITSPTYTLVNEYACGKLPLIHFDLYRIGTADELFEIGWEDYLQRGAVLAVEWSENAVDALPSDTMFIQIEKISETQRKITISDLEVQ